MKKIFYSICVGLLSLTFMACPYKSDVPLEETPSERIDEQLLGEYEKKNSSTYTYTVERDTDKRYRIIEKSTTGKEYIYYGWTTTIDGETYLQTYKKPTTSSSKKYYYIYRLKPAKSGAFMTMLPLTKNITEDFNSSSEFKRFIRKYQDLSFFFEKEEKYYKSE